MKRLIYLLAVLFFLQIQAFAEQNTSKSFKQRVAMGLKVPQNQITLQQEKNRTIEVTPLKDISSDAVVYNVSCNNNYCAFSLRTGKIIVYDLKEDKVILDKEFSQGPIYSVDFHPFKNTICFGDRKGTITVYDLDIKKETKTISGEDQKPISVVEFSPDGTLLGVGYLGKGTISLYNTSDYSIYQTMESHKTGVYSLSFSPDSKLLASGSRDKTLKINKIGKDKPLQTLVGHNFMVLSADFSKEGPILASGGADAQLLIWIQKGDIFAKEPYFKWVHGDWVTSVKFFKDYLITGSKDKKIRIFNGKDRKLLGVFNVPNSILNIDITPDGKNLILASKNILIYDLQDILSKISPPKEKGIRKTRIIQGRVLSSPEEEKIIFRDKRGKSYIIKGDLQQEIRELRSSLGENNLIKVEGVETGKHIVSCSQHYAYSRKEKDLDKEIATECIRYNDLNVSRIAASETSTEDMIPSPIREFSVEKEMRKIAVEESKSKDGLNVTGQIFGKISFINVQSPVKTIEVNNNKGQSVILIIDANTQITRQVEEGGEPVKLRLESLEQGQKVNVVYQRDKNKSKALYITISD